jgi:hypothetical protein
VIKSILLSVLGMNVLVKHLLSVLGNNSFDAIVFHIMYLLIQGKIDSELIFS